MYAKDAVKHFKEQGVFFEEQVKSLANTAPSRSDVTKFFMEVYQRLTNTTIVINPTTEVEENNKVKAVTKIAGWTDTFDTEGTTCGHNYWVAANAVTNSIQHQVYAKGKKKSPASRAYGNLVGKNATDSSNVFNYALSMS